MVFRGGRTYAFPDLVEMTGDSAAMTPAIVEGRVVGDPPRDAQ